MKNTDATTQLLAMEEKRTLLLDQCTRALCGDNSVDTKLFDAVTGGRYSEGEGKNTEEIKTLLLALRWLGLPVEKKKVTKRKAAAPKDGSPAKRRGRPKGTGKKSGDNGAKVVATPPPAAKPVADQPSA